MASLPNGSHSHNDDEDHGAFDIDEDDVEEIIELPDNEDVPMDSGSEAGDDDAIMEEDEDEDGEEGTTIGEPAGPDTSTAHFASHHPHAVFAIAAHPVDGNLIVSGGADDIAYLWRADTGEELARLTGHTDSVSSVGWSCDGELVATGGMDGRVRVWRRVRPAAGAPPGGEWSRWEFLTSIEDGPDEVTWLAWHPKGNVLAAGSNAGAVWLYNFPSGRQMTIFAYHATPSTSGLFTPPSTGKRLLTSSSAPEPTLALWNPSSVTGEPEYRWSFAAQPGSDRRFALAGGINCLAANTAGTVALVGGQADPEDNNSALRLVSLASGGPPLGVLDGGHDAGASIEAVAWADISSTVGVWLSAGTDGKVCAWDGTTGKLRWMAQHDGPLSSLVVAENAVVVTGSADKTVRAWDLRTGATVGEVRMGHRAPIHALTVTRERKVVSGGDDGLGRVHAL